MPKVTIAIPTYNRCTLLKEAIESVLNQSYKDFELLVVDNASTDSTKKIVKSFRDKRIIYHRNKTNIGMMNNWNKSIELSKGDYIMILGDDDKLHANFLTKSMQVHENHKDLGFSFSHCNKVNFKGNFIMKWGYKFTPKGYLKGDDYLFYTIKYGCCLTNSSTVLINKKVFKKIGLFEEMYGKNTFDFNMWIKIADKFPVYFINAILCDYRLHPEQVSEIHWRKPERPTGKIGTYLELLGACSRILNKDRFKKDDKRKFITDRIMDFDSELSRLLKVVIPDL